MDHFINGTINEILKINKISKCCINGNMRDGGLNIQCLENELIQNILKISYKMR